MEKKLLPPSTTPIPLGMNLVEQMRPYQILYGICVKEIEELLHVHLR